jgi:hypothetical protein
MALIWHIILPLSKHFCVKACRFLDRKVLPGLDRQGVQDSSTVSPLHSDQRLLAIPASLSRVSETNPNMAIFQGSLRLAPLHPSEVAIVLRVIAHPIRAMRT